MLYKFFYNCNVAPNLIVCSVIAENVRKWLTALKRKALVGCVHGIFPYRVPKFKCAVPKTVVMKTGLNIPSAFLCM